ncbi:MAG TPA: DMT family transporter [Azospirillaceae bacterium]|nr:DMT family transporter [Azospirillaceae bacterium]
MVSTTADIATDNRTRIRHGIFCIVVAVSTFATMDVLIKLLGAGYSPWQIHFVRVLFAWLPFLYVLRRDGGLPALRTGRIGLHLVRAVIGMLTFVSYAYAFQILPLVDVYAISFASPLLMTLLAVPMLGEAFGWRRGVAICVGFLGVLVVLRPTTGTLTGPMMVPLAGTLLYCLSMILGRLLSRTDTNAAILFYLNVVGLITSSTAMLFIGQWPVEPSDWVLFAGIGLLGSVAQILQLQAFRLAPPSVVSPFQYLAILWGLGFGWFLFGEWPDGWSLFGSVIIVASGLYILWREAMVRGSRRPVAEAKPRPET